MWGFGSLKVKLVRTTVLDPPRGRECYLGGGGHVFLLQRGQFSTGTVDCFCGFKFNRLFVSILALKHYETLGV